MMNEKVSLRPNIQRNANLLSRIFYLYVWPLLWTGYKRELGEEDLCEPLEEQSSELATARLTREWEKEKRSAKENGRKASLVSVVVHVFAGSILAVGPLIVVHDILIMLVPLAMGRFVRYFRFDSPLTVTDAIVTATAVAVANAVQTVIHHGRHTILCGIGDQIRIATSGMIVEKGIRLSSGALRRATVGHIVTLLSSDVGKFRSCCVHINHVWISPFLVLGYIYLVWREIGAASLLGVSVLLLLSFFQSIFSERIASCREAIASRTDKRVSVMGEILSGIRTIKMYAWEDAFEAIVRRHRSEELKRIHVSHIWEALEMGVYWAFDKLIVLAAFLCYTYFNNDLSADQIFLVISLYGSARWPVACCMPLGYRHLLEGRTSLSRIQNFLELEEFAPLTGLPNSAKNGVIKECSAFRKALPESDNWKQRKLTGVECAVEMNNFSCTWDNVLENECAPTLRNITLEAQCGQLVAIVGPVGCGKSAMLSSILGETHCVAGNLNVIGRISYSGQEPWIFSGTLRENILFGERFDEKWYQQVLSDCALDQDVARMLNGDLTLVGDRGHSLSGGQKARVSLARALYHDADIYLLDDPLSAVDPVVGRFLFNRCILACLKSKLTILATHQTQYLKDADQILVMKNGKVIVKGNVTELNHLAAFAEILQETEKSYSRQGSKCDAEVAEVAPLLELCDSDDETKPSLINRKRTEPAVRARLVSRDSATERTDREDGGAHTEDGDSEKDSDEDEQQTPGCVCWRTYSTYLRSLGWSTSIVPLCLVFAFVVQLGSNFTDWWISKWTNAVDVSMRSTSELWTNEASVCIANVSTVAECSRSSQFHEVSIGWSVVDIDAITFRNVFAVLTLSLNVLSVFRCILFRNSQLRSSQQMHDRMVNAVLNAKITFFDKNPVGRILKRFSKDVDMMDGDLGYDFFDVTLLFFEFTVLTSVVMALSSALLVPTLLLFVLFLFYRRFYLASAQRLEELESTSRSSLYAHISSIMNGLTVVRAFSKQHQTLQIYHSLQDKNTSASYLSSCTSSSFELTVDCIVLMFISGVSFFLIYSPVLEGGEVGLLLLYVIQLTGFFSWLMSSSATLQKEFESFERIVNYTELPRESNNGKTPPTAWPTAGRLQFNDVSLLYENNSDWALRDIAADILPNEKIGIVGRTGAGKSSLLRTLFRLNEFDGEILIDGIDINKIDLKQLRKRLSVIPQDPVLFVGTLRENLDPFSEYEDVDLWAALQQVQLSEKIAEQELGLAMEVQEGGSNFSVGQRQLICLARAILRRARLLVIDEATANVDAVTDSLIQQTIRERFADSTVLTVAHRLHTIIDCDRVMVLEKGRLVEFEHPAMLLRDDRSHFSKLVNETGVENSNLLRKLADASFESHRRRRSSS